VSEELPVIDSLVGAYADFVSEISKRLDAIAASFDELTANAEHANAWQNCDFCWLQIRKICELMAVSVVAAHHFDGGHALETNKWSPKDVLLDIAKMNNHPTPIPISDNFADGPNGERQIILSSKAIEMKLISEIYGRCGDILHVGSLNRILEKKVPAYDLAKMAAWLTGFRRLISNHVLFLPGMKKVLVCWWGGSQRQIFLMESEGANFVQDDLLDFTF